MPGIIVNNINLGSTLQLVSNAPQINLTEQDQADPAGRLQWRMDVDILYLERSTGAGWATKATVITFNRSTGDVGNLTLNAPVMKGTWTASGAVVLPNLTVGPLITISGASPNLTFTRTSGSYPTMDCQTLLITATRSAGAGGNIDLYGKTGAGSNLAIALYGDNASGTKTGFALLGGGTNTGVFALDSCDLRFRGVSLGNDVFDIKTPVVITETRTGTLFDAAGLTDSKNIWLQPANTILIACKLVLDVQFAAAGMTDLDVTVGDGGNNAGILNAVMNLTSDAAATEYKTKGAYFDAVAGLLLKEAATQWVAYSTAVGANLNTLSAGQVTFYFTYLQF